VLSALPYVVGVAANAAGGIVSDWLVQRVGLRLGRRAVGVFGLSFAAIFMAVATLTSSGGWALTFLSLSYAGILLQQPNIGAVAVDTCRENGGVVFGFINSAAAFASVISSIAFGYIAEYFGSNNAPFVPMVVTLAVGCVLWLSVDATRPMFTKPIGARALVVAAVD
jgi:MFS family permease